MINYTPKHFDIQELVSKSVYTNLGARSLIVMDPRILYTIDLIRDHFNRFITVNDWSWKGKFSQRGFRDSSNVGAKYSQHRYGRAIDFDVKGLEAEEVRQELINNADKFEYITTIEKDVNWIHIDCRNSDRIDGKINLING
jgi:hypothetical protein